MTKVMTRILFAAGVILAALTIGSAPKTVTLHERFYFSRTCPDGGAWYLAEHDDISATFECSYDSDDTQ